METDSVVAPGGQPIAYRVVRSARRHRTVTIRVAPDEGVVVLAPEKLPRSAIRAFVAERGAWVADQRRRLEALPAPVPLAGRTSLPVRGGELPVTSSQRGRTASVRREGDGLVITAPATLEGEAAEVALRRALVRWYGREALAFAEEAAARLAGADLPRPARILIRDQRTRWGSCAADGTVRLNWRVALLPPDLCDYVVVHELAHLVHRDHGAGFWGAVASVLPDHRARRKRIREAGLMASPW